MQHLKNKILLVEDDLAIMETLSMFLNYEGYDVLRAANVDQALEVIEETCPDLVLLDYMLQDDTAEPVVDALRAKYGERAVVLLLTAADDPIGKGEMVCADAVVAKPFELDVLLRNIRESIDRRSQSGMAMPLAGVVSKSTTVLDSVTL
jgi:DNA-binding response OmpR family regulator